MDKIVRNFDQIGKWHYIIDGKTRQTMKQQSSPPVTMVQNVIKMPKIDPMDCAQTIACIEWAASLDLTNTVVTFGNIVLWEICGDITFCTGWVTIDWTNTTNTGIQNFDNNYVANYDGSTMNISNWATFNISDGYYISTNNAYTFDWDIINYIDWTEIYYDNTIHITYNETTIDYYQTIQNYDGDTINWNNATQNVYNSTITYDEKSDIAYGWDVYIGWDIININYNTYNATTVVQTGTWVTWTDPTGVLVCDGTNAVATSIDPVLLDHVKLVVGWVQAGNDLWQWITGWTPAIYGSSSELRWLTLTPAIINASDFGAAFQFGDSNSIEVSWFGFAIPWTDTITWVKVEVIFSSTPTSVSVDCITMTIYHTDWTPFQSGVNVQQAGSTVVTSAVTLNFQSGAAITDMWGGVAQIDIVWGTVPGWVAYYEEYVATGWETNIVLSNTPSGANWIWVSTESSLYGKQGLTRDWTYDVWTNTIIMTYPLWVGDVVSIQYIGFIAMPNPGGSITVIPVGPTTNANSWEYILITYALGASTINLPDALLCEWWCVKVKKFTGEDVLITTIVPFGAQLIDGYTWATMNINRTMYTFTAINGNWYLGN